MGEINRAIGDRIRNIRLEKGMKQEELAFAANMQQNYLSKIECGAISTSIEKYSDIAFVLDVPLPVLLDDTWPHRERTNRLLDGYSEKFDKLEFEDQQHILEMLDMMFGWRDAPPQNEYFQYGDYLETYLTENNLWEVVEEEFCLEGPGYCTAYGSYSENEKYYLPDGGKYVSYGIACNRLVKGVRKRIAYIPDICLDKEALQKFVDLLQVCNVFLVHFKCLVEDFIASDCNWDY